MEESAVCQAEASLSLEGHNSQSVVRDKEDYQARKTAVYMSDATTSDSVSQDEISK